MDKFTRKDLKTDRFALEVEHTVEYMSEHRKQMYRYGAIAAAILVAVLAFYYYNKHQQRVREQALNEALRVQQAPVGEQQGSGLSFKTAEEKRQAASKALSDVASQYSGSDEGTIARYYLGVNAVDQGNLSEAEKHLRDAADSGNNPYASLAKLTLAQVYQAQGKLTEAEQLLRSVIANPTVFVSKEQATLELAKLIAPTKPDEARKLLEPLRTERGTISRAAITALGDIPAK